MNQVFEMIAAAINPNPVTPPPVMEMEAIWCNLYLFREDGTSNKRITKGDRLLYKDGEIQQNSYPANIEVLKCFGRIGDTDFSILAKHLDTQEEFTITL